MPPTPPKTIATVRLPQFKDMKKPTSEQAFAAFVLFILLSLLIVVGYSDFRKAETKRIEKENQRKNCEFEHQNYQPIEWRDMCFRFPFKEAKPPKEG